MQVTATDTTSDLVARIERLEARIAIRELVARYCFTVDERDIDGIAQCFTQDGVMRSVDGVMNAAGREAVIAQFHGRFAVLGPSNHYTHDHIIDFDEGNPRLARGTLNTHAEVVRNGELLVASLRYQDRYAFEDGQWRFAERVLAFFYYARPADLPEVMRSSHRNRAYAEPVEADYPERSAFWQRYYPRST